MDVNVMEIKKIEKINALIEKAKIESAKSQGVIDSIKKKWKEEYNTDDVNQMKKQLSDLVDEENGIKEHLHNLYEKIINSYDWKTLELELSE